MKEHSFHIISAIRQIQYDNCVPFPKTHSRKPFKNGRNTGRDISPEGTILKETSLNKVVITIKFLSQKFSLFFGYPFIAINYCVQFYAT